MLLTIPFIALESGDQVIVLPGDVLRVVVGFKYTAPSSRSCVLLVRLYVVSDNTLTTVGAISEVPFTLNRATTATDLEVIADLPITADLQGGTYGLQAKIEGTDAEHHIDNVVVVESGVLPAPTTPETTLSNMMGPLMMIMAMGMIIPVVAEQSGG